MTNDFREQYETLEHTLDYQADKRSRTDSKLMKGLTIATAAASVLGGLYAFGGSGSDAPADADYVPGQFIVKFSQEVDTRVEADGNVVTGLADIDALNDGLQGEVYIRVAESSPEHELDNYYVVDVDDSLDLDKVMESFRNADGVELVEYDIAISLLGDEPNDPFFHSSGSWGQNHHDMWGLRDSNILEAWEVTTGSEDIVLAIIDTGVAHDHPDLEGKVTTGFNAIDGSNNAYDGHGHGTHVAGTTCANTDNGIGIAGVNQECTIMPVKVLSDSGSGSSAGVAKGIVYAADNGAHVINMSLGGPGHSQVISDAIEYADSKDVITVVAAGNSNSDAAGFHPAGHPLVITVGAMDPDGSRADFSNFGDVVDVAAPGRGILSTVPDKHGIPPSRYHCLDTDAKVLCELAGTSMASPHVAGEVALILAANNDLIGEREAVREIVQAAVNPVETEPGKPIGTGRIDFGAAVNLAVNWQPDGADYQGLPRLVE